MRGGPEFDAVLLAGGRARRFGADKPAAAVGGRALIEWTAAAVAGAARLVVVGPPRDVLPDAVVVREDPPGAGPVPALRAGLARVRAPRLALLAADLPFLRPVHIARLLDAMGERPGAVLVDEAGREQWLAGCWRTGALRAALEGHDGAALRGLLGPLEPGRRWRCRRCPSPWYDCDTPEELAAAGRLL
ncbi:molybdenum cofactor guanylyltransferase [Actinomadura madurae]|uniref:molybdenum cofactor guanylyltransferase n=1 Tax=Actinomadura madurae TaxID=1993 RepID=UPI0020D21D74|nr:NTP transferase domain-containing protein [Actinomadura madurae]MCQ0011361.1 NTP transferase domain-containing protein [Actinomadura madurae]